MGCGSSSTQSLPPGLTPVESRVTQSPGVYRGINDETIQEPVPVTLTERQKTPEITTHTVEVNHMKQTASDGEEDIVKKTVDNGEDELLLSNNINDVEVQEPQPVMSAEVEPEEEAEKEEEEEAQKEEEAEKEEDDEEEEEQEEDDTHVLDEKDDALITTE